MIKPNETFLDILDNETPGCLHVISKNFLTGRKKGLKTLKTFVALCTECFGYGYTKDVALHSRLPVNQTSTNLARLRDKGFIKSVKRNGKKLWIAKPVYVLHFLIRRGVNFK